MLNNVLKHGADQSTSLYGTAYKFSRNFFTGWVIVSLLWGFFSFFAVTIFPIIEGRHLLWSWATDLLGTKARGPKRDEFDHHQHPQQVSENSSNTSREYNEKGVFSDVVQKNGSK